MYEPHPLYKPPPDDAVLWRYIDFTKFVSLLSRKALHFAPAAMLGDPFEGSLSEPTLEMRKLRYSEQVQEMLRQWPGIADAIRRKMIHVSCWHQSDTESAAMWRLYAGEHTGIAIRTTFAGLKQSLQGSEAVYVGKVNYIDYKVSLVGEGNVVVPYLHKRREFSHEQEVRALIVLDPEVKKLSQIPDSMGLYHPVELTTLLNEVVVAPYAPDWFTELVASEAQLHGLPGRVRQSDLTAEPFW